MTRHYSNLFPKRQRLLLLRQSISFGHTLRKMAGMAIVATRSQAASPAKRLSQTSFCLSDMVICEMEFDEF